VTGVRDRGERLPPSREMAPLRDGGRKTGSEIPFYHVWRWTSLSWFHTQTAATRSTALLSAAQWPGNAGRMTRV